jgi:hypothetical protein
MAMTWSMWVRPCGSSADCHIPGDVVRRERGGDMQIQRFPISVDACAKVTNPIARASEASSHASAARVYAADQGESEHITVAARAPPRSQRGPAYQIPRHDKLKVHIERQRRRGFGRSVSAKGPCFPFRRLGSGTIAVPPLRFLHHPVLAGWDFCRIAARRGRARADGAGDRGDPRAMGLGLVGNLRLPAAARPASGTRCRREHRGRGRGR